MTEAKAIRLNDVERGEGGLVKSRSARAGVVVGMIQKKQRRKAEATKWMEEREM